MLDRPANFVVTNLGVIGCRLAGLCLINRWPENVFRLVRGRQRVRVWGRRCVARGARCRCRSWIADLPCGRMGRRGKSAESGRPFAIKRERPSAFDRVAWPGVGGRLRLEQWQYPLGAIGGPRGDAATVFFAQRYFTRFEVVVRYHFPTVITLARVRVSCPTRGGFGGEALVARRQKTRWRVKKCRHVGRAQTRLGRAGGGVDTKLSQPHLVQLKSPSSPNDSTMSARLSPIFSAVALNTSRASSGSPATGWFIVVPPQILKNAYPWVGAPFSLNLWLSRRLLPWKSSQEVDCVN
jgi:hypothetical protein